MLEDNPAATTAPKKITASTALEGDTFENFNAIKEFMMARLPGNIPDNAAVLRFALHTAALRVANMTSIEAE